MKDGANAVDTKPLILPYAVLKPDSEARTPVSVEAFEAVEQLVTQAYNTVKQTLYPAMHVSVSQKWLANTEGEIPVSVASRSYVEATPYDKGKAIEALLATYLPKVERVVTLGDANNDAEALSTLEFPRPTDNPLFPDIIPNYAVAMLLPENKNRRFLTETLGFNPEAEPEEFSSEYPHIQLYTPETWATGVQTALTRN